MSRYEFEVATFTPGAVADNTNLVTATIMAIQGGTNTQVIDVWAVNLQGQAAASNVNILLLGVDSTIGTGITALATPNSAGLLPAFGTAPATLAIPYVAFATTAPKRSNVTTVPKKPFCYNAFGGGAYWHAYDRSECFQIAGNGTTAAELSLSGFTGTGVTGPTSGEIIFEVE